MRPSEYIGVNEKGHLMVENIDVVDLVKEFGTPLYVSSENQIRHNYRRFFKAFADLYGAERLSVFFAIKSNNNLAIRRIFSQEGAGGDCFGMGELYASLLGGADPQKLVMNGSNKPPELLEQAVRAGVTINVDSVPEMETLHEVCGKIGITAKVKIRAKPFLVELKDVLHPRTKRSLYDHILANKWGMTPRAAAEAGRLALESSNLDFIGINFHCGRLTNIPKHFAIMARGLVSFIAELRESLEGWTPQVLDFGGGYAHGRDPEGMGLTHGGPPIEEYAFAIIGALKKALAEYHLPEPHLELEPGRFLIGNTTVLLTRVDVIKKLPELSKTWVNVDASTNHMPSILIENWFHQVVLASDTNAPTEEKVDIVGPYVFPMFWPLIVLCPG